MKRALLTISALLILCVAMTLCAGAVIQDSDIGTYIRFDSQQAVDNHTTASSGTDLAFDAENAGLRYTVRHKTATTNDVHMRVIFGEQVKINDYPYVRITYKVPTVHSNGKANTNFAKAHLFFNQNGNSEHGFVSIDIGPTGYQNYLTPNDKWERAIFDLRIANDNRTTTLADKSVVPVDPETYVHDFRFDFPNDAAAASDYECIIYDVGLFKTAEAAASYNDVQDFYYLDLSKEDNGVTWTETNKGASMTYDATEQAHVWHYDYGDARLTSSMLEAMDWFSPSTLPVFSTYFKSTDTSLQTFLYNVGYSPLNADGTENKSIKKAASMASGRISTTYGSGHLDQKLANNTWGVGKVNIANAYNNDQFAVKTAAALIKHGGDWINKGNGVEGNASDDVKTHFKYIAYYATDAEASKLTVGAPEVTAVMPADATVNGKISGVTAAMEYRAGGKYGDGEWISITENDITEGAISVAPGVVYNVRYKETETANAGYIAEVYVPYYFNFELTGIKASSSSVIDVEIKYVDGVWKVKAPYGTNLQSIIPVFTLESGVPTAYQFYNKTHVLENKTRAAVALYSNSQNTETREPVQSGTTVIDASSGTVQFTAVQSGAIHEYINIEFEVAQSQYTDEEIVEMALADVLAADIPEKLLISLDDGDAIEAAVKDVLETSIAGYAGTQLTLEAVLDDVPVAGTAQDRNGTDGKASITCTVTYNDCSGSVVKENLVVPAKHFRWILNFGGNEIMLDNVNRNLYTGRGGLVATDVEDEDCLGGAYTHIYKKSDADDTEGFNFYIYPGQNGVPSIEELFQYKVVVYSYRHNAVSANNNQLYYYTDRYDSTSANAYQYFRMTNTTEWHQYVYEVDPAGSCTTTEFVGDTSWSGTVSKLRFDFARSCNEVGEENRYVDLDYIGFFTSMEEAEAFIANPVLDSTADSTALEAVYADELTALEENYFENIYTDKYDYTAATIATLLKSEGLLEGMGDGIVLIDELVNAKAANLADPDGVDGKVVYRVAYSDAFNNGNVIYSPAYTVAITPLDDSFISLYMAGAQIRTEDAAAAMGGEAAQHGEALRFGAYLDLDGWQNEEGVADVEYGMLLTSAAILGDDELTLGILEENRTIKVVANNIYAHNEYAEGCDRITYTAAIYGVGNKDAQIVARPYVTYHYNGTPVVVYGRSIVRSFNQVFDALTGYEDSWDSDAE